MPVPETTVHSPDFPKGCEWINAKFLHMGQITGKKVVLVDFWDLSCINCLRTLPYLKEWNSRYSDKGLITVGIHSPEFRFSAERPRVEAAVKELGIEYPVVIDSNYEIWQLYGNRAWPSKYLWGSEGTLNWYNFGEGMYLETEQAIQQELLKLDPDLELPEPMAPIRDTDRPGALCYPPTEEIYLGTERGFQLPAEVERSGWKLEGEYCESQGAGSYIELRYEAAGANAVLAPPEGKTAEVEVKLDGHPHNTLTVNRPANYELVADGEHGSHTLRLDFPEPSSRAYTLTFTPGCVD